MAHWVPLWNPQMLGCQAHLEKRLPQRPIKPVRQGGAARLRPSPQAVLPSPRQYFQPVCHTQGLLEEPEGICPRHVVQLCWLYLGGGGH
jgi:hypothetical protein